MQKEILCMHLEGEHLSSQNSDGVKVSLTYVRAK